MIRLAFIILLLLLGQAFFIISQEDIDFHAGRETLSILYLNWFGQVYNSAVKLTGEVTKVDWFSYENISLKNS
jgi:hypothetical protein